MSYDFIWSIGSEVVQSSVPRTARELATHENVACSISGGADSDIMLDIVNRLDTEKKVHYVFFDTGIEMRATLKHLIIWKIGKGLRLSKASMELRFRLLVRRMGSRFCPRSFLT